MLITDQTPDMGSICIKLICIEFYKFCIQFQQEAHGPQRSPEKTVQINKHILLSLC